MGLQSVIISERKFVASLNLYWLFERNVACSMMSALAVMCMGLKYRKRNMACL